MFVSNKEIPFKKHNKENQKYKLHRFSLTSFSFRLLFCTDNRYSFKLIPSGLNQANQKNLPSSLIFSNLTILKGTSKKWAPLKS